jgi:hypothetical protein
MNLTIRIPDDLARRFGTTGELERRALENLALEQFRLGRLKKSELARLLGFAADAETEAFLAAHGLGRDNGVSDEAARVGAQQAAANIVRRRKGVTLGGLDIKTLINEGRP